MKLHHFVELKFFWRLKPAERGVSDNIGDRVTDTINLLEVVMTGDEVGVLPNARDGFAPHSLMF